MVYDQCSESSALLSKDSDWNKLISDCRKPNIVLITSCQYLSDIHRTECLRFVVRGADRFLLILLSVPCCLMLLCLFFCQVFGFIIL